MVILETPRLVLRHPEPDDLDALSALYRVPEIRRYFPDGTQTREQTAEEIEWFRNGHPKRPELGLWVTVERNTGALLGRCGLLPWEIEGRHEVELAFLIDKARWREGFASEAARAIIDHARDTLRIDRLICLILPGNIASAGVAKKAGMTFERDLHDRFGRCHLYSRPLA